MVSCWMQSGILSIHYSRPLGKASVVDQNLEFFVQQLSGAEVLRNKAVAKKQALSVSSGDIMLW